MYSLAPCLSRNIPDGADPEDESLEDHGVIIPRLLAHTIWRHLVFLLQNTNPKGSKRSWYRIQFMDSKHFTRYWVVWKLRDQGVPWEGNRDDGRSVYERAADILKTEYHRERVSASTVKRSYQLVKREMKGTSEGE